MRFFEDIVATLAGHVAGGQHLPSELPSHAEVNRELAEQSAKLRALNKEQEHERFEHIRRGAEEVRKIAGEIHEEINRR